MSKIGLYLHKTTKTTVKLNKASLKSIEDRYRFLSNKADPYEALNYLEQEVKVYSEGARVPIRLTVKELLNELVEIEDTELARILYDK